MVLSRTLLLSVILTTLVYKGTQAATFEEYVENTTAATAGLTVSLTTWALGLEPGGEIPPTFYDKFQALTYLQVSGLGLEGRISEQITKLSNLEYLSLSGQFTGPLPSGLGSLSRLTRLELYGGHFEGGVPTELAELSELTHLQILSTSLGGTLPANLFELPKLRTVIIYNTQIGGPIPSPGTASMLEMISLAANRFSGRLRQELFNSHSLQILNVYDNRLTGPLPSGLIQSTQITEFVVDNNDLSGSIPDDYFGDRRFSLMSVGGNWFHGTMPQYVGYGAPPSGTKFDIVNDCSTTGGEQETSLQRALQGHSEGRYRLEHVTKISCSAKGLTGTFPADISIMDSLDSIDVSLNEVSGSLSSGFFPDNLIELYVNDNQLTGSISGDVLPPALKIFNGRNNRLTGSLPADLTSSSSIKRIDLRNNDLTGTISDEVFGETEFHELLISNNWFYGTMPQHKALEYDVAPLEKFQILNDCSEVQSGPVSLENAISAHGLGKYPRQELTRLSCPGKKLIGTLPCVLYEMVSLEELDLEDNALFGVLGKNIEALTSLTSIRLNSNSFSGSLPDSLDNLPDLLEIYLGDNEFDGVVPELPVSTIYTDIVSGEVLDGKPAEYPSCGIEDITGSNNVLILISASVFAVVGISVVMAIFVRSRRSRRRKAKTRLKISDKVVQSTFQNYDRKIVVNPGSDPVVDDSPV